MTCISQGVDRVHVFDAHLDGKVFIDNAQDQRELGGLQKIHQKFEGVGA